MPSGRRPVDERSTRQRVKVEVFVSVEDRVHALEVEMDDGGHELMPYRKASIHPCYRNTLSTQGRRVGDAYNNCESHSRVTGFNKFRVYTCVGVSVCAQPHTSQRQTRHDRQEIHTVTITKSRMQKERRGRFSRPPLGAPWQSGGAPIAAIIRGAFGWRRWGVGVGGEGGDGGSGCWKRARHRPRAERESRRPWRPSAP